MVRQTELLLVGVGAVVWGLFSVLLPRYSAMLGRLTYALTWPREGFEPRYPEIWLARLLGVVSLGVGASVLYQVLG